MTEWKKDSEEEEEGGEKGLVSRMRRFNRRNKSFKHKKVVTSAVF